MNIIWKGSTNYAAGRRGWEPEAIVIHIMDGSLIGTDAWFNNPASGVSAHYGIGKAGEVHQYVKETDTAFHAGTIKNPEWPRIKKDTQGRYINPNYYTIGVEHAGWGEQGLRWPDEQRQASLELVRAIADRWAIPIDEDHVIPHRQIRSSKPLCPGRGLEFAAYLDDLAGMAAQNITGPEQPFAMAVRAVTTLNVRARPIAAGGARRRLLPGDTFTPVAVVAGEIHSGNGDWYRNAASEYIWAGGTDRPYPV
jgi:N-acetyl-anhydromuramyl-L-alanine amidase AmpD